MTWNPYSLLCLFKNRNTAIVMIYFSEKACKSFLQIWSHLLKKSLMENFIFCAVYSTFDSHSEHNKASKREILTKIVNGWELLTFFGKSSILDAWLSSDYTTETRTAQKMKFCIKGFFSKCGQIWSFWRTGSHLLNEFLMENCMFLIVWCLDNWRLTSKQI